MKIETPENFDDGITYVAPKGKFKSEKMKTLKYGLIEEMGNNIFFNLGVFDKFEEAVNKRKSLKILRKNNIFIIRRVEE